MKAGQILIEDSSVPVACLVRKLGTDGAQILVMTTRRLPTEFVLCCEGRFHSCFVNHRGSDRLTVGFEPSRRSRLPAFTRLPQARFTGR